MDEIISGTLHVNKVQTDIMYPNTSMKEEVKPLFEMSLIKVIDIASSLDIQKGYSSATSSDLNLYSKDADNERERKNIASGVTIESFNCDICRRVCNKHLSLCLDVEKNNLSELRLSLEKTCKLKQIHLFDHTNECDCNSCVGSSSESEEMQTAVYKNTISDEAKFPLKTESDPLRSPVIASDLYSSIEKSSMCISSGSDEHIDNFSDEDFPFKEADSQKNQIIASDFNSSTEMSDECISSSSDVHINNFSEEADFSLKEEADPQRCPVIASDLYSSTEMSECISEIPIIISGESFKVINLIELAYHIRESDYSKARMSNSFEDSDEVGEHFHEKTDSSNAELLQNQLLNAKTAGILNKEEEILEKKDSQLQKDSEDCQTSIYDEAKNLLIFPFGGYLEEIFKEISPTEEKTQFQSEESEFKEEHAKAIYVDEIENKEQFIVKTNYPAAETGEYDALDDDLVLKILFSVYDFICEIDENVSFHLKNKNLMSENQVKSDNIHSEPICVKTVRMLIHFLDKIKSDLKYKKDKASELKINLEDMKEIYSYDFKSTEEVRELVEIANKYVSDYNNVYAGIMENIEVCDKYHTYLTKILDFFQSKCLISSPGLKLD